MLNKSQEIQDMVEMLPDSEQTLAFEMVKRLVLAWDPDYTKLTPAEKKTLTLAMSESDDELISGEELKKELGL